MKKNGEMHATTYDENDTQNPCSFYKIMSSPSFVSKMLRLPESFTSKYGDELSSTCHLIVPTGVTHQVALVEENNGLWFQDGWGEFMSRFSIGYGYFMTFTYEGNSTFKVNLFDLTTCEISYDSDKVSGSSQSASHKVSSVEIKGFGSEDDEAKSEESSKTLTDTLQESEDGEAKSEESSKTITDTLQESEGYQFVMDSGDYQKSSSERTEASSETANSKQDDTIGLPCWLIKYDNELRALEAAGIPIPEKPFFVCSIARSSLGPSPHFAIPRGFGREHLKCKTGDTAILKMSRGREWEVVIRISYLHWSFGKGWITFAREACLEWEDVCLFELTDAEKYVFKVRVVKP